MSHYSDSPGHVRVDRFRAGGKWYDTFMVDMTGYYSHKPSCISALSKAMLDSTDQGIVAIGRRVIGEVGPYNEPSMVGTMFLVCLEPYHMSAYPVVLWLT